MRYDEMLKPHWHNRIKAFHAHCSVFLKRKSCGKCGKFAPGDRLQTLVVEAAFKAKKISRVCHPHFWETQYNFIRDSSGKVSKQTLKEEAVPSKSLWESPKTGRSPNISRYGKKCRERVHLGRNPWVRSCKWPRCFCFFECVFFAKGLERGTNALHIITQADYILSSSTAVLEGFFWIFLALQ